MSQIDFDEIRKIITNIQIYYDKILEIIENDDSIENKKDLTNFQNTYKKNSFISKIVDELMNQLSIKIKNNVYDDIKYKFEYFIITNIYYIYSIVFNHINKTNNKLKLKINQLDNKTRKINLCFSGQQLPKILNIFYDFYLESNNYDPILCWTNFDNLLSNIYIETTSVDIFFIQSIKKIKYVYGFDYVNVLQKRNNNKGQIYEFKINEKINGIIINNKKLFI